MKTINSQSEVDRLVKDNIKLAYYFARKYKGYYFSAVAPSSYFLDGQGFDDDLVSACMLALLNAAKTYDKTKGAFSTWTSWYVFKEMTQLRKNKNKKKSIPKEIVFADLNNPQEDGETINFQDTIPSKENIVEALDEKCKIENLLKIAKERGKNLKYIETICNLKVQGKSFREIGSRLGVSYQRVQQIWKQFTLELELGQKDALI
jgi:RNA polymerase sigma factor (sigma-70 family)